MLGSPHGRFQRLQIELENKLSEIAVIKKKLEAELDNHQPSVKHLLRNYAEDLTLMARAFRQLLSEFTSDLNNLTYHWTIGMRKLLVSEIANFCKADRQQISRLTAQNKSLEAELSRMKDLSHSQNKHSQFAKKKSQSNITAQPERSIQILKLQKCNMSSPANILLPIQRPQQDMSLSPALQFSCQHLQTIKQQSQPTPSDISGPKAKLFRCKHPSVNQSCIIIKTQPSDNSVIIPTNRPQSQRQVTSSKPHKDDLSRAIGKVTPSKAAVKQMRRSSYYEPKEDCENGMDWCAKMKWGRDSINMPFRERAMSIIELGGKRRSSSKEGLRDRDADWNNRDDNRGGKENNGKSQSKEKIKVTIKEQKRMELKARRSTISKIDRRNSFYAAQPTTKSPLHISHLCDQLAKLQLTLGDKRYELRYEGTKKDHKRSGTGKLEYINGLIYEGNFKDDVRHGYGVLSINGKEVYKGQWEADQLCGKGYLTNIQYVSRRKLPEDSMLRLISYEGDFKNNMIHGDGSLILSNGQKFEGFFLNNIPQGELEAVTGSTYSGKSHHFY